MSSIKSMLYITLNSPCRQHGLDNKTLCKSNYVCMIATLFLKDMIEVSKLLLLKFGLSVQRVSALRKIPSISKQYLRDQGGGLFHPFLSLPDRPFHRFRS